MPRYTREETKVDIPPLEAICVAPQADEMSWTPAPLPPEKYVSDLELVVDAVVESRAYRELLQIAIEQLRGLQKQCENLRLTNRELRTQARARS